MAETKVAANEATLVPLNEPVAPVTEQTGALVSPDNAPANPTIALTKIATLGDPAVLVDAPKPAKASAAKADKGKTDRAAIKKRLQAEQRRRLALRARLAQQQQLQQANPFAQPATQPTVQPVTATRNR